MAKLTVIDGIKSTLLKALPLQSSQLNPEDKVPMVSGKTLAIQDNCIFDNGDGHYKIVFDPSLKIEYKGVTKHWVTGYLYAPHWSGIGSILKQIKATETKHSAAGSSLFLQPTPLFNQNDNKDWGDDGSSSNLRYGGVQCGMTSLAMVLATVWPNSKVKALASQAVDGQFETWIGGQFKKIGAASTAMEGHIAVLTYLGIKATATRSASIADLKQALSTHPCVLGTAYKSSGHFIAGVGVSTGSETLPSEWPIGGVDNIMSIPADRLTQGSGIIINDPYGCREQSGSGNNWDGVSQCKTDTYGLLNFYSDSWLKRVWVDGGEESGWGVFLDPSTPNVGNEVDKPIVIPAKPVVIATADNATITIVSATFLKSKLKPANELQPVDKKALSPGDVVVCRVIGAKQGHGVLLMPDGSTAYVFNAHFTGQEINAGMVGNMTPRAPVDPAKLRAAIGDLASNSVPDYDLDSFCQAFIASCGQFTITKREHVIHFLAQVLHESGGLTYLEELASGADYDDRDDLGNTTPEALAISSKAGTSAGRFYKGHGLIQVTGYANHKDCSKRTGIDCVNHPDLLCDYPGALVSALDFWASRGPSLSVDVDSLGMTDAAVIAITKVVNGGINGLDDRLHYFHKLLKML